MCGACVCVCVCVCVGWTLCCHARMNKHAVNIYFLVKVASFSGAGRWSWSAEALMPSFAHAIFITFAFWGGQGLDFPTPSRAVKPWGFGFASCSGVATGCFWPPEVCMVPRDFADDEACKAPLRCGQSLAKPQRVLVWRSSARNTWNDTYSAPRACHVAA